LLIKARDEGRFEQRMRDEFLRKTERSESQLRALRFR
jgi:hypothetical protein